jgi:hypothetical protein
MLRSNPAKSSAMRLVLLLLLMSIATLFRGQAKPVSQCLAYEPSVVTLSGTLVRKTLPGPPNYESIQKGDRAETSWHVQLAKPVCVDEDKNDPRLNPAQKDIRSVQLVLTPEMYEKYKSLVGKQVRATGTLFGEHTGHHHTPVLLTIQTMTAGK